MSQQSEEAKTNRRYSAANSAVLTEIGKKTADLISLVEGPGWGLFGPYVSLAAGPCIARIILNGPGEGCVVVGIAAEHGLLELTARRIDLAALDGQVIELRTVLPRAVSDCEVRMYCEGKVRVDIRAIEIEMSSGSTYPGTAALDDRLKYFTTHIARHVQGWLGDRMPDVVRVFASIFNDYRICGNIAEIGIHHGLSFFLFNVLRCDDELCFAIDVFDKQQLNIDNSGSGSRDTFVSYLDTMLPLEKPFVRIIERDSLTFSLHEFTDLFAPAGVKLFSVDGGHTAAHVCNDLMLVQEVLVPGGFVALDDFFGPHWPDVTAGFYQFMATRNRRLSPILFFQNKLVLTTISEHHLYLHYLEAELREAIGKDEFHAGRWKRVEIAGADVLSRA